MASVTSTPAYVRFGVSLKYFCTLLSYNITKNKYWMKSTKHFILVWVVSISKLPSFNGTNFYLCFRSTYFIFYPSNYHSLGNTGSQFWVLLGFFTILNRGNFWPVIPVHQGFKNSANTHVTISRKSEEIQGKCLWEMTTLRWCRWSPMWLGSWHSCTAFLPMGWILKWILMCQQ